MQVNRLHPSPYNEVFARELLEWNPRAFFYLQQRIECLALRYDRVTAQDVTLHALVGGLKRD